MGVYHNVSSMSSFLHRRTRTAFLHLDSKVFSRTELGKWRKAWTVSFSFFYRSTSVKKSNVNHYELDVHEALG